MCCTGPRYKVVKIEQFSYLLHCAQRARKVDRVFKIPLVCPLHGLDPCAMHELHIVLLLHRVDTCVYTLRCENLTRCLLAQCANNSAH